MKKFKWILEAEVCTLNDQQININFNISLLHYINIRIYNEIFKFTNHNYYCKLAIDTSITPQTVYIIPVEIFYFRIIHPWKWLNKTWKEPLETDQNLPIIILKLSDIEVKTSKKSRKKKTLHSGLSGTLTINDVLVFLITLRYIVMCKLFCCL